MLLLFALMINTLRFLTEKLLSSQHTREAEELHSHVLLGLWCFFLNVSHCLTKGSQAKKPATIYMLPMLHGILAVSAKHCFPKKHFSCCYARLLSKYHARQAIACFLLYLSRCLQWLFCGISDTESEKPITISLPCILVFVACRGSL